nr:glucosyltransferase domain-containing protein [uncultured Acetatifactor sp.]
MAPGQAFGTLYRKIRKEWKVAFFTCFVLGLLIHMPVLLSDIPNHDGLDSMYFDQNMITSGRWFLTVACGFSSYYTLPWLIGILGLVFLGCAAAALCELLEVRKTWAVMLVSGLLVSFPALASTFAYVYTLDGYMLALLLAVLAVLFVKRWKRGFVPGALCLAFSMGIYQGYLSFAMILSVFAVWMLLAGEGTASLKEKLSGALHYLYMGALGAGLYFVILQALLRIQGKELDHYQGIDGLGGGGFLSRGILAGVSGMYRDFFAFTFKGNVLFQNVFSLAACCVLAGLAAMVAFLLIGRRKCWKNPLLFGIMGLLLLLLPAVTNVILVISPSVNYHLLMRYQWVLYAIGAVALISGIDFKMKTGVWLEWLGLAAAGTLVFCYSVTDNIAYSNLQKRYEKTYAYCVRLLDRIEQTEGYYQGIPIAMIGVVGEEQFPVTDITLPVTSNMIGMSGDGLLYRGRNYQLFMRHYLGATLNILPEEAMLDIYVSEEYIAMDSFPGPDSIRVVDGVMYVKTENVNR